MFSLHERSQRNVCRVVFLGVCLLPTILTVIVALYLQRPWLERDWRNSIEQSLHVRAELTHVSSPRPTERRLSNLKLRDLHSDEVFLSIDQIETKSGQNLHADQIQLQANRIAELAQGMQVWLTGEDCTPFNLAIEQVALSDPDHHELTLSNVQARCQILETGERRLSVIGTLGQADKQLQLVIERRTDNTIRIALDARQAKLPTWLLQRLVPGAQGWEGSALSGTVQWQIENGEQIGTLSGVIAPIDVQKWLGKATPHRCQSQAELTLEQINWKNSRIELAQGSLAASSGTISRTLLKAFQETLFCVLPNESLTAETGDSVSYDKAACWFRLNADGLKLVGQCETTENIPAGCILQASGQSLVLQPTYETLPLGHFVRVFCPLERDWLPATADALEMARQLPIGKNEQK